MWNYGDWGWMNFGMHGLGMIAFWGVILFALIALLWSFQIQKKTATSALKENPLEILRTRYAKGEINSDQFKAMQAELQDNGSD